MPVKETPVDVYNQDYLCDACGGRMRPTGFASDKAYVHKCNKCGVVLTLDKVYPAMICKEKKE